jgi:glycosyltransferase involved in cell wall biosynthesis
VKISVAVPVRNEERSVGPLVESLLRQTLAPDEVLLADGGSTDGTVREASRYAAQGVRVLEIGPAYPGRGRNAAIRAARNDWIALIDAGCRAEPDWLSSLAAAAESLGPGVVFGEVRPELDGEWDVAQALAYVGPFEPQAGVHPPFIASSLIHRTVWQQAGGFPEHLRAAEDLLFMEHLRARGVASVRRHDAVVRWRLPSGPRAVFKRFRLYSAHHLAAGLGRTWHHRVMAMDLAGLALVLASPAWPPALLLAFAAGASRLLRTVWTRRHNVERAPLRPDRLLRVGLLIALSDLAMWAGAVDYVRRPGPGRG